MNNILKNILLLALVLVLSYFTADDFGRFYVLMFGQGGAWIGSEKIWNLIIGFPLSLIFFLILVFYIWVFKTKKAILWLISPLLLWQISIDLKHIYLPISLALISLGLAAILRKVFSLHNMNE
jgi:hypothetical protein